MAAPERVVQAVEAAIVASAHLEALQRVSAAMEACERLGRLSSGRWRSAARDMARLEEDLSTALDSAAEMLSSRAQVIGVPEEALWTVGDAAGTLDLLRESALEALDEGDERAARVLESEVLFGASFLEDPELPDRGTTLLFGWPNPLTPASWPWQANWVVGEVRDGNGSSSGAGNGAEEGSEELDLFEAGELEDEESLLSQLAEELACGQEEARTALRAAAMALTRASLQAATGESDDDEDEEDA
jgi:hypothetical protein